MIRLEGTVDFCQLRGLHELECMACHGALCVIVHVKLPIAPVSCEFTHMKGVPHRQTLKTNMQP
jgi:hypothetical protein